LAEDMTTVLARALARTGGRVTALKISPTMSRADILCLCQTHYAEKALLLSLYEWKVDTAAHTRVSMISKWKSSIPKERC
jgi:hypothetical protein